MKKAAVWLLSLALVLALSACAQVPGERKTNDTPDAQKPLAAAQTPLQQGPQAPFTAHGEEQTASTTAPTTQVLIERARAIELALQHAGLQRSAVRDLEAELDRERHGIYWEVDFEHGVHEYSYDIHAQNGAIVRVEREKD